MAERDSRIRLALVTAGISKATTFGLQALAIPLAVSALGSARYGVYASVVALLAWTTMLEFGLPQALTQHMAAKSSHHDGIDPPRSFAAALSVMAVVAVCMLLVAVPLIQLLPITAILGVQYAVFGPEARAALTCLALLMAADLMLSVVTAARMGLQETHLNNAFNAFGNGLSAVGVVLVVLWWPTVGGLVVALCGGPVLGRLLNACHFLAFSHKGFVRRPHLSHLRGATTLLVSGGPFIMIKLSAFLKRYVTILILARYAGPNAVATADVLFQMILFAQGPIVTLCDSLWPAVAEANVSGATAWLRKTARWASEFAVGYGILVGLILGVFGYAIVHSWIGPQVAWSPLLQALGGAYLATAIWTQVQQTFSIGLGFVGFTTLALGAEGLLAVSVCALWPSDMTATTVPLALLAANLLTSCWVLPSRTLYTIFRQH